MGKPLLQWRFWSKPVVKLGIKLTLALLVTNFVLIAIGFSWWGHGRSGSPSPLAGKVLIWCMGILGLGVLPPLISSPILGFGAACLFVYFKPRAKTNEAETRPDQ